MNAKKVVLVTSLMLLATAAQCRDFGKRQTFIPTERVNLSDQWGIVQDIATRKAFGVEHLLISPIVPVAADDNDNALPLDLCLSRCAGPTDVVVMRRAWLSSSGAVDLNDTVVASLPIKMAMGLDWKALPNLRISADYERKMTGDSLKTAVVVAEEVGARMQLAF